MYVCMYVCKREESQLTQKNKEEDLSLRMESYDKENVRREEEERERERVCRERDNARQLLHEAETERDLLRRRVSIQHVLFTVEYRICV